MADSNPLKTRKSRDDLPRSGGIKWWTVRRGLALGYRRSARTWFARAYVKGALRYDRLGEEADISTYDAARDKAEEWWRKERGDAPRRYDVLAALEDYARTKTANLPHPERARVWEDLRALAKHLPGELLGREVGELKPAELEHWRDSLPVKPATRRRVFTPLAAALTNAWRIRGAGDLDTWRRVKPIRIPSKKRSRLFVPTEAEVAALLRKCEPDFAALVRAALLTACRYGELANLMVEDFDAERGTLPIKEGKTGERDVLLSSAAAAFFAQQVRGKTARARIFTTATGEPWRASMQHRRMRAATTISAFVFYSFRHIALSRQLAAGIPIALVAKNAGTSEAMLRQHYHKFIREDRVSFDRALLDRVAAAI